VAWIGPGTARTVGAFRTGVHRIDPAVTVLVEGSSPAPARCKEAALTSFLREAVAVMAGRGLCAEAVAEVSAEQNRVAISLGDFELPEVAVDTVVRAALSGIYSG